MSRYRWLLISLFVLGGFAALELWPNDEARIQDRLRELALVLPRAGSDAGQHELSRWLAAHATADLIVRIPDRGVDLNGPDAFAHAAHAALVASPPVQITVAESSVHGQQATVRATTICTLISQGATELKDIRRISTTWQKQDGDFRLALVEVGPNWHDQPEARP